MSALLEAAYEVAGLPVPKLGHSQLSRLIIRTGKPPHWLDYVAAKCGLSIKEISLLSGLAPGTLPQAAASRRVTFDSAMRICAALNLDKAWVCHYYALDRCEVEKMYHRRFSTPGGHRLAFRWPTYEITGDPFAPSGFRVRQQPLRTMTEGRRRRRLTAAALGDRKYIVS